MTIKFLKRLILLDKLEGSVKWDLLYFNYISLLTGKAAFSEGRTAEEMAVCTQNLLPGYSEY